jgi:hypothetical protein
MAENWIKVRKSLKSDLRVIGASRRLGVSHNEFFGALVAFFCWADEHTANGELPGLTLADIDEPLVGGLPGLAQQLEIIGWISVNDDGLTINSFEDHMSQSAKKRAVDRERKVSERCPKNVRFNSDKSRTKVGLEGEGERDKSNTKRGRTPSAAAFDWAGAPDGMDTPEVRAALDEFVAYRRESGLRKWAPRTIKAKLNEYAGRPDAFVAAVTHSIANGWQGIFEDKKKSPTRSNDPDQYNHPAGGAA